MQADCRLLSCSVGCSLRRVGDKDRAGLCFAPPARSPVLCVAWAERSSVLSVNVMGHALCPLSLLLLRKSPCGPGNLPELPSFSVQHRLSSTSLCPASGSLRVLPSPLEQQALFFLTGVHAADPKRPPPTSISQQLSPLSSSQGCFGHLHMSQDATSLFHTTEKGKLRLRQGQC